MTGSEGVGSIRDGGALDGGTQAEALRGMPAIARRGISDIATLTLSHGNELNAQERTFWSNLLRNLGNTI